LPYSAAKPKLLSYNSHLFVFSYENNNIDKDFALQLIGNSTWNWLQLDWKTVGRRIVTTSLAFPILL